MNLAFSEEENKIIQLKYSAKKIGAINSTELKLWVKTLLLKINVITGWTLPSNEIVMTVLKDQFEKKLKEDYPSLNTEEIEYAFRRSGTSTEDWGKELNLNMIDKILWPYELHRRELSLQEERAKQVVPERKPYNPEDILNQYRYEIETAFQAMKKGYRPLIHIYFEETLQNDGMLNEGENVHEFFVRALSNAEIKNLYVKV